LSAILDENYPLAREANERRANNVKEYVRNLLNLWLKKLERKGNIENNI
jgi:hypothetical protein